MDHIERWVAGRLAVSGERGTPPDGLARRIREMIEVRRRRRRRALALGSAIAVAVVLTVPAVALVNVRADPPVPMASSPVRPERPAAVGDSIAVTIPRELPGGSVFHARALGVDGAVIGIGVQDDGEWDDRLWMAVPQEPVPQSITEQIAAGTVFGPAMSEQTLFWVAYRDEPDDLFVNCADLLTGGDPHELGESGMLRGYAPVLVDQGAAVWTDRGGQDRQDPAVWTVAGCADDRREVARGVAVAFAYPDVYVVPASVAAGDGQSTGSLRQFDIETGQVTGEYSLPPDLARTELGSATFAANDIILAAAGGSSLAVADRGNGRWTTIVADLPGSDGGNGTETHLTAGDRIIAYASIPITVSGQTSGLARSLAYDPVTGASQTWDGELYAAGGWLLWEGKHGDEAHYYLGRVAE
jgi:hypothetical protein